MASSMLKYATSSVVKKQVMAVTGLLLCGFLISHLAGNCLMYLGPEAFNSYAHALITNPAIYLAEAILAAIFLTHLGLAAKLTIENRNARPQKYFVQQNTGRGASFASSTMPFTGMIILIFLVKHLIDFKFGPVHYATYNGVEMRDLYKTVIDYFQSPVSVLWYIFCMLALGIHVSHGFWSAFQSFGFWHPKYTCMLRCISKLFAILVTVGYSALPIFSYLQGGN